MAAAPGIAEVFAGLSSRNWYFLVGFVPGISQFEAISGTWSQVGGAGGDTIRWQGDNPSKTSNQSVDAVSLEISTSNGGDGRVCNINHTNVPLEDGDTIVYTQVDISFDTPSL